VVSNKGEILVGMKDGVEYVLRFGDTYRGLEDDENSTGNSRYIYAFARVNTNLLDAPQLEPVPAPLVEPSTQAPVKNKEETPDKGAKGDTGEKGKEGESPKITPPGPPPNFVPGSPPPTTIPPAPPVAIKDSPSNVLTDGNQSKESSDFTKKKAERDAEIARINASNASKQKEFNEKVAEAQKRVNELNENLAEWYYVISNDVYGKIRLERTDFVKSKEDDSVEMPDEVSASHILISYKGADRADAQISRSKDEAKSEAERIRGLILNQNQDFAEMAKQHSDGPSKTKGGDLGKFKFEVMAKAFSEAAFGLDVGSVSEVVETGFGFHIIKRTE